MHLSGVDMEHGIGGLGIEEQKNAKSFSRMMRKRKDIVRGGMGLIYELAINIMVFS